MNEKMFDAEQMVLLMSLQKEMAEMKRRNEKTKRKHKAEILALRKEKEEMKRKFVERGSICRADQPCWEVLHHPRRPQNYWGAER